MSLNDKSQLTIDVKSLIGVVAAILSMAAIYFTLTGQIAQLQLDTIRMQDSVAINSEFRILWPRGDLGALPDDARGADAAARHHRQLAGDDALHGAVCKPRRHAVPLPRRRLFV